MDFPAPVRVQPVVNTPLRLVAVFMIAVLIAIIAINAD